MSIKPGEMDMNAIIVTMWGIWFLVTLLFVLALCAAAAGPRPRPKCLTVAFRSRGILAKHETTCAL